MIALHLHELDRLPDEPRRQIRRLQRLYVEEWVDRARPRCGRSWPPAEARVLAHAAFGLMNSTPFLGGEVDRTAPAPSCCGPPTLAALRALTATPPGDWLQPSDSPRLSCG